MNCEHCQSLILDQIQSQEVQEHVAHCAECRKCLLLWQGLNDAPVPPPSPDLEYRFEQRLRAELQKFPRQKARAPLSSWGWPLAASLLLAMSGAFAAGYYVQSSPRLHGMNAAPAHQKIQTIALMSVQSENQHDLELMQALLERIDADPSPEVRMVSVEALYLFSADPELSGHLDRLLQRQKDPRVKRALMELISAIRSRRAMEAMDYLVQSGQLDSRRQKKSPQRPDAIEL